jgi:hypothetical protein
MEVAVDVFLKVKCWVYGWAIRVPHSTDRLLSHAGTLVVSCRRLAIVIVARASDDAEQRMGIAKDTYGAIKGFRLEGGNVCNPENDPVGVDYVK